MAKTDDVRQDYRPLTPEEVAHMHTVKSMGQDLIDVCRELGQSRELSLAVTKVEEAVMWATKHITGPKGE